jgi:hypothetical protein
MVCTAGRQDRDGAKTVLLGAYLATAVRFVFADAGFAGRLVDWAQTFLRTTIEIVRKPTGQRGFVGLLQLQVTSDLACRCGGLRGCSCAQALSGGVPGRCGPGGACP